MKNLTKLQRDILLDCCVNNRLPHVHGANIGYYLSRFKTSASQEEIQNALGELVATGLLAQKDLIYGVANHQRLSELNRSLWWPLACVRGKSLMHKLWNFLWVHGVKVVVGVCIGYAVAVITGCH